MKKTVLALLGASTFTGLPLALAQSMSMPKPAASAPAGVANEYTEGEVRKIDQGKGEITLKHGEIKNLGMAPMAMMFKASKPAQIARLKVGDKVRFRAAYESGKYVLTDIEKTK